MKKHIVSAWTVTLLVLTISNAPAQETWRFKQDFLPSLIKTIPEVLADQETTSGRFGSGVWIVNDQHIIFPLAAAWSLNLPDNPYYHDAKVLEAVMDGGDALIDAQNKKGMWLFRKKDNSTWGDIYMPWTYSRWLRAYGLIRDGMPADRRARWEKALLLGFNGIAAEEVTSTIHNIPTHHAMAIYHAGQLFDKPEWCQQASKFMARVVEKQSPDGYWSENNGPVVGYNMVYTDALGVYYSMSGDKAVLKALQRAARFHSNFTYPDGSNVETVDERQVYYHSVPMPNAGFAFSAEGRGYMKRQWDILKHREQPIGPELAASHILYGEEGPVEPAPPLGKPRQYVTQDGLAGVFSTGDWFLCISAYHTPVPTSRWIMDRQNLVSLFHRKTGLILGGGNTKLQPLWSTFTVGDVSLLKHKSGDENPNFTPPPGIWHVPEKAELQPERPALVATYNGIQCSVTADLSAKNDDNLSSPAATLIYEVSLPTEGSTTNVIEAHVPLMPDIGSKWTTQAGKSGKLGSDKLGLQPGDIGKYFEHNGMRVMVPSGARIVWPVLPHNQYTKDGHAGPEEGKIVLVLPFTPGVAKNSVTFIPIEK